MNVAPSGSTIKKWFLPYGIIPATPQADATDNKAATPRTACMAVLIARSLSVLLADTPTAASSLRACQAMAASKEQTTMTSAILKVASE
jgi:hypothetical protein